MARTTLRRDVFVASSSAVGSSKSRRRAAVWAAVVPMVGGVMGWTGVARGTDLWFDTNGATAGSGATGTWNLTNTNWSTDAAGTTALGATNTWQAGAVAHFYAGTNAGGGTITMSGDPVASGLVMEEGTTTMTGGLTIDPVLGLTITSAKTAQVSITGVIAGTGNVSVGTTSTNGRGQLNLMAQNTFTGDLILTGGTSANQNRVQMDFGLANDASKIRLRGNWNELGTTNVAGDTEWKNEIVLNDDGTATAAAPADAFFYASNTRVLTISGVISGTNTNVNYGFGVNGGNGRGTVVLNSVGTYTGDTYVSMAADGLVKLGIDNPMPQTTNLTLGGTQGGTATVSTNLDLNGHTLTVGSLASKVSGANGSANIFSNNGASALVLNGVKNSSFAGLIGAQGDSNVSVTKTGMGVQTFTQNQFYAGPTTINGGMLSVAGLASSNVTVGGAGAALGSRANDESVVRDVTLSDGGAVAPGGAGGVGLITANAVSFADTTRFSLDWTSGVTWASGVVGGYDALQAQTLTLDGGTHFFDLNLPGGAGTVSPGTYKVATASTLTWDGVHGFTPGNLPSGTNFSYGVSIVGNDVLLDITPLSTTLRWDANGGGGTITEGAGTWSNGSGNFTNIVGGAAATWDNNATADVIIGDDPAGNGGVIALGSDITVHGRLTFKTVASPYTIGDGGAGKLTLMSGLDATNVGVGADNAATFDAPVVLGASQGWAVNGSNTLTVQQSLSQGSGVTATLTKSGSGTLQVNGALTVADLEQTAGTTVLAGPQTVGAINTTGGTLQINGAGGTVGTIGTSAGRTDFVAASSLNVTTVNATGGTTTFSGGGTTIGTLAQTGGTVTFGAGGNTIGTWNVAGGNANLNASGNDFAQVNVTGTGLILNYAAIGALGNAQLFLDNASQLRVTTALAGQPFTLSNDISVGSGGGWIWVQNGTDVTYNGKITSSVDVAKAGNGLITFDVAPGTSYPSMTIGQPGGTDSNVIVFANQAALGTAGPITFLSGGIRVTSDVDLTNPLVMAARGNNHNRVDMQASPYTLSGAISGTGDMYKYGGSTLTLEGNNTMSGGNFDIEEGGTIVLKNASALGAATIVVNGGTTLQVDVPSVEAGFVRGNSNLVKTGTGTISFGGVGATSTTNNAGASLQVDAGAVVLKHANALGNNNSAANMAITLGGGTSMTWAFTGTNTRAGNFTMNSATLTRPDGLANAESTFENFTTATMTLSGTSTIRTLAASTGTSASQILGINMPVVVSSGANVTLENTNPNGSNDGHLLGFRGSSNANAVDDGFRLQANSLVTTLGPGQVRFGRTASDGKPIIGQGQPGSEATLRLSNNSYMTDLANTVTPNKITSLVVQGSGDAGLRIEAKMNATYVDRAVDTDLSHDGSTGLFGDNTTGTATGPVGTFGQIGSPFTVLSTARLGALSSPFGSGAQTSTGTLTVAATDPAGATGTLSAGPAALATTLRLALDNASGSGNLVYRLDGQAPGGGLIANFAGLTFQRTKAGGTVTGELASATRIQDLLLLNGTRMDLTNQALAIDWTGSSPASTILPYIEGQNIYSSNVTPALAVTSTIAVVSGTDLGLSGSDTTSWFGLTIDETTMLLKAAYYGDSNLDGRVDGDDFTRMDLAAARNLTPTWLTGDFNRDGARNAQDFFLLDRSYGMTHGQTLSPDLLAQREAQFGSAYVASLVAAVPEPTGGLLLAGGSLLVAGRRRRAR